MDDVEKGEKARTEQRYESESSMFILQLSKPEFSLFLYENTAITSFNVLPTMAYGSFPITDGKM